MEQTQRSLEGMEDRTFVFGSLFVVANRLETLLARHIIQGDMEPDSTLLVNETNGELTVEIVPSAV